jgi:hypothetical protein
MYLTYVQSWNTYLAQALMSGLDLSYVVPPCCDDLKTPQQTPPKLKIQQIGEKVKGKYENGQV